MHPQIVLGNNNITPDYPYAFELFKIRCRTRNLSPRTIEWYSFMFDQFYEWLPEPKLTPQETTVNDIRAFLDSRLQKGNAPYFVLKAYDALNTFFRYLVREGILGKTPFASLEKPKGTMRDVRPLSVAQIQALLAQPDTKIFTGLRNWTMLVLFLDTGIRLSELINLKANKIDYDNYCLSVIGKGNKERTVFFGSKTKVALMEYARKRGDVPNQETFFLSQYAQPLKMWWIERLVRKYARKAKIDMQVTPHSLRHTMATQYILNGGDPFSLQHILGHTKLDMVKKYIKFANKDIAVKHREFGLIDKLGILPNEKKKVIFR